MNLIDEIEKYIQSHERYSEKCKEIGVEIEKMPGPEQMLRALECAVGGLNSVIEAIKGGDETSTELEMHHLAEEALTQITKELGLEKE